MESEELNGLMSQAIDLIDAVIAGVVFGLLFIGALL